MPASSVQQGSVTAYATGIAYRADPSAPATRYRIRLVNTHATDRLYVAFTEAQANLTGPQPEVVEPDFGVWDAFVDSTVEVWVRASGTNAISVRVIQFAT